MRSMRDVRLFRRGAQQVAAAPSLTDQILAYGPAQWIRFTADNVTLNGSNISAAADLSPNARDVSQGTSTTQPAFANPGADFDGTDDGLGSAGGAFLNGVASLSYFSTVEFQGNALSNSDQIFGYDAGNFSLNFGGGANDTPRLTFRPGGVYVLPVGPIARSGTSGSAILDVRLVNGASRLWDNGVGGTNITTAWAAGTIPCTQAPSVGAGSAAGGNSFAGVIFSSLVFTPALSLADQAAVRALLAQLDGVTL